MRTLKSKRASILQLVCVAAFFSLAVFVIQSSFFTGDNGSSDLNKYFKKEIRILSDFQSTVKQCVANRGFGLTASIVDHCKLILKFPQGTNSTWAALFIAPPVLPLKPCKNLFQLQTFTPSKAGASLAIKATTAIADTTTVDCIEEARNEAAQIASDNIEREYLVYNDAKTVFCAEACDDLGGEFCGAEYQRGVY
ncbi:hypothetical protein NC653_033485 [Populus alba x Populus x berolinensis]|uniref:Uncharacterized protein n=1 Tax=Populus alba x Populus x berolinensis TaxID=444605 RepID=A0AAD6LTY6_9ROSI|nr:hypothetical protein NC653_033485 [Populus alba x Populus x berolinensis]